MKEPVKQIIEVGPAKDHESTLTDKHTEKTPYDTLIEYDPNLEVGKVVEDQAGAFGEKEITKTWKLKNGQPVGDPETSEKVVKDPQPRKLRVGTKCNCETPTEEPSQDPSDEPTQDPTEEPSQDPSEEPSQDPTEEPSKDPSDKPNEPGKPGDKPNEPGKAGDKPSEEAQAPGTSGGSDTGGTSGGDGNKPADSSGTASSPLPRTGVSVAATLAAAAVLIAGGVGLLAVRRRPSKR